MPDLSPSFEYQAIRDEIRAEHSLIASRLSWYVTSQSFLVTAFAISCGNNFRWFSWFSTLLLPSIGFLSSLLIFPSIVAACRTIELWHSKQTRFFESHAEFKKAFDLKRQSWVHRQSLLFPKLIPLLFGSLWLIIFICGSR